MINHEELSTGISSVSSSSSSSSPIHLQHIHHHRYTVQSPSSQSHDGDKSSINSNQIGAAYTVQSPSTLSNDGDKSSVNSNRIGPAYTVQSPSADSPSRVSSTFSSSGSRVSGARRNLNWNWNRPEKGWNQCYVIVEEEEVEEEIESVRWQWMVWVLLAFGLVGLVIWGVATPYRPRVEVKSLAVNNFYFGEGLDYGSMLQL